MISTHASATASATTRRRRLAKRPVFTYASPCCFLAATGLFAMLWHVETHQREVAAMLGVQRAATPERRL